MGTDGALVNDGAGDGFVDGGVVGEADEERVHEDKGGTHHKQVDEPVEKEKYQENYVLVTVTVSDRMKSRLYLFVHHLGLGNNFII